MFQYKKYNIKTTDSFRPDDFPKVVNELEAITKAATGVPGFSAREFLIPFLKNDSFRKNSQNAHPSLTTLFTEEDIATTHMQWLFDSCGINQKFSKEYEDFICSNFPK